MNMRQMKVTEFLKSMYLKSVHSISEIPILTKYRFQKTMAPIKPELMKIMLDTPLPESESEESMLELDTPIWSYSRRKYRNRMTSTLMIMIDMRRKQEEKMKRRTRMQLEKGLFRS